MADEIKKSVLGSVRLDSDVREAVRAMPVSLNVFLRESLLGRVRPVWDAGPQQGSRKKSKKALAAEAPTREQPAVTEDGDGSAPVLESVGMSETLASDLDVVGVRVTQGRAKATVQTFRRGPRQKGDAKR